MTGVVVTGIGAVTPIGSGRETFWNGLLAGVCGIRPVTSFDTSAFRVHIGAEVPDFHPERYLRRLAAGTMGRTSQLAIAAGRLALADAGLEAEQLDPRRTGVAVGTTSGEPLLIEAYNNIRKTDRVAAVPGETMARYPCHVIPVHMATEFGLNGPCLTIPTACAAGNYAIGYAFDLIRTGRADTMLCGGADAFSRITYMGFARLAAIAPERCQPFDKDRKGMVPGEGAAILLLERVDKAKQRKANIYAQVLGLGLSCDAHHMTAPHPTGDGAIRSMTAAMNESKVRRDEVDYISAHGTGTLANDRAESLAVSTLFGSRAPRIPMSSIKSMLGHTMGAASALEAAACCLALSTGWVPPTINLETPDPECPLDYVPNKARKTDPRIVLNNAYAFGGNNASLCLARHEE
jgi:3-oxoacyl-[acyl-carrier-protein] synthase II